ncbi:hypothetical protein BGX28_006872 [Mortierella sp. GBA30]|nr:hypothetical protein BGX28_006872 [Mortierella sp. GBA30]
MSLDGQTGLKAMGYIETRWKSAYIMAKRIVDLPKAIFKMQTLQSQPDATADMKSFWKNNQGLFLNENQLACLEEILCVLRPASVFTEAMCENGPAVTDLYPMIHKILTDGPVLSTADEISLRAAFEEELRKNFSVIEIPNTILIATFLSPGCVQHPLFETGGI